MDNPAYDVDIEMDDVDIAPEDDVYNTPNTTTVDEEETSITPTSTLRLKQQVLRNKLDALYHHLGAKGSLDFLNLDRFKMKTNSKTGLTDLLWYNGENWVSLNNQRTGENLAVGTLKTKFGGLTPMKNFLNLEQTPPSIDQSIKAANLLKSEIPMQTDIENIPLFDLSSVVEDICIKTREASQNTDVDMREFLGISKALQSINGELRNNTAKLSELDKRIKRDTAKLKEIEDNPEDFSEEQKGLYKQKELYIGSVVGAILSFLGKTVGFLAQHTWALIVFAVGLIGAWLIRRAQS